MKRKIIIAVSIILGLAYLPIAPVFINFEYGTQPPVTLPNCPAYAYLWITEKTSSFFLLACGFWNSNLQPKTHLFFRDEKNHLKRIKIFHAIADIDGVESEIIEVSGSMVEMNRSVHNMYGGSGGSCYLTFALPTIPSKFLNIRLEGEFVDNDETTSPFQITVCSNVKRKFEIIPFYTYIYSLLTVT